MTPDNQSYSNGYNSYNSSGFEVGDIVKNNQKDSPNFGTWGEVVSVEGTGNEVIIGYKIGNPEYPYQTGWIIYDMAGCLDLCA